MKRFLAFSLAVAMMITMAACSQEKNETLAVSFNSESETVIETTSGEPDISANSSGDVIENAEATFTVSVCGLDLKYPLKWKEQVQVTASDDRVSFACGETKLFDLTFNTDEGTLLGTVVGDEYTVIRIVDYPFETENQDLYMMLEDINVILQNLMKDYNFTVGEALEKEDNSTFDIETSVVTMKYPAKWRDKVQVDVSEEGVTFSNDGTPLFDLIFSECEGFLLGTYSDTPIYIVDYSVDNDEQAAMQEDVNVILQYLMKDKDFVIND